MYFCNWLRERHCISRRLSPEQNFELALHSQQTKEWGTTTQNGKEDRNLVENIISKSKDWFNHGVGLQRQTLAMEFLNLQCMEYLKWVMWRTRVPPQIESLYTWNKNCIVSLHPFLLYFFSCLNRDKIQICVFMEAQVFLHEKFIHGPGNTRQVKHLGIL